MPLPRSVQQIREANGGLENLTDFEIAQYEFNRYRGYYDSFDKFAEDIGFDTGSKWGNRLSASIDNYQAGLLGVGEALTGSKTLGDMRRRNELEALNARQLAASQGAISSRKDVGSVGDALDYVGGLAVDSLPYLAEAAVGGAAGRALLAGGKTALGLSRGTASTLGAAGASYPSAVGDILQNQRDQSGETNVGAALIGGVPYAALNAVGIEGALARNSLARSGIKALDNIPGVKGVAARTGVSALKTAAVEGPPEMGQEMVNQTFGRMAVDPNETFWNDGSKERFTESFIGGAALGGVFGGAAGGWRRSAPENEQYDLLNRQQTGTAVPQYNLTTQMDPLQQRIDRSLGIGLRTTPKNYEKIFEAAASEGSGRFVIDRTTGLGRELSMQELYALRAGIPLESGVTAAPAPVEATAQPVNKPKVFSAEEELLISHGVSNISPKKVKLVAEIANRGLDPDSVALEPFWTALAENKLGNARKTLASAIAAANAASRAAVPQPAAPAQPSVSLPGQPASLPATAPAVVGVSSTQGVVNGAQAAQTQQTGPQEPQAPAANAVAAQPAAAPAPAPVTPDYSAVNTVDRIQDAMRRVQQRYQAYAKAANERESQYNALSDNLDAVFKAFSTREAERSVEGAQAWAAQVGPQIAQAFDVVLSAFIGPKAQRREASNRLRQFHTTKDVSVLLNQQPTPVAAPAPVATSAPARPTGKKEQRSADESAKPRQETAAASAEPTTHGVKPVIWEFSDREKAPVGAWVKADFKLADRQPVYQVRELDVNALYLPELDSDGRLQPEKRRYLEPYTERAKAGEVPPPISVIEMEDGRLRVVDGHRRVMAARAAGKKSIRALVSPLINTPSGKQEATVELLAELFAGGSTTNQTQNATTNATATTAATKVAPAAAGQAPVTTPVAASTPAPAPAPQPVSDTAPTNVLSLRKSKRAVDVGAPPQAQAYVAPEPVEAPMQAVLPEEAGDGYADDAQAWEAMRPEEGPSYDALPEVHKQAWALARKQGKASMQLADQITEDTLAQDDVAADDAMQTLVQIFGDDAKIIYNRFVLGMTAEEAANEAGVSRSKVQKLTGGGKQGAEERAKKIKAAQEKYGWTDDYVKNLLRSYASDDVVVESSGGAIGGDLSSDDTAFGAVDMDAGGRDPSLYEAGFSTSEKLGGSVSNWKDSLGKRSARDRNPTDDARLAALNAELEALNQNDTLDEVQQARVQEIEAEISTIEAKYVTPQELAASITQRAFDIAQRADELMSRIREAYDNGKKTIALSNRKVSLTEAVKQVRELRRAIRAKLAEVEAVLKRAESRKAEGAEPTKAAAPAQAAKEKPTKAPATKMSPGQKLWETLVNSIPGLKAYGELDATQRGALDDIVAKYGPNVTLKNPSLSTLVADSMVGEGDTKYGKGGMATDPYTAKELLAELKRFVRADIPGRKLLVVDSVVDLLQSSDPALQRLGAALSIDRAYGVAADGRAVLVANRIQKGQGRAKFMHEVGTHLGLESLLPKPVYDRLVKQIKDWAESDADTDEVTLAARAVLRVERAGTPDADRDAELLAYFVEEAVQAGIDPTADVKNSGPLREWFRTLWAAFKVALRKLGFKPEALTAQDVVNLAFGAARLEIAGTWHGTAATFRNFRNKYIGTGEGATAFGWGTYLAQRTGIAKKYWKDDVRRKSVVDNPSGAITVGDTYIFPDSQEFQYLTYAGIVKREYKNGDYVTIVPPGAKRLAAELARGYEADPEGWAHWKDAMPTLKKVAKYGISEEAPEGNLMRVDTAVEDSRMFDYDKSIDSQHPEVRQKLLAALEPVADKIRARTKLEVGELTGKTLIGSGEDDLGLLSRLIRDGVLTTSGYDAAFEDAVAEGNFHEAASHYLRTLGLDGIKFLDAYSRGNNNTLTFKGKTYTHDELSDLLRKARDKGDEDGQFRFMLLLEISRDGFAKVKREAEAKVRDLADMFFNVSKESAERFGADFDAEAKRKDAEERALETYHGKRLLWLTANESNIQVVRGVKTRNLVIFDDRNIFRVGAEAAADRQRMRFGKDLDAFAKPATRESSVYGEAAKRLPSVKREITQLVKRLDSGELTPEAFAARVELVLKTHDDAKSRQSRNPRQRGADYIRQRLLEAKRRGDLSEAAVDFAEWFILKNPALVEDLAVSIRTPKADGASGNYDPFRRLMTLLKESNNDETAVHEILHHMERMMPADVQAEIRKAWVKSLVKAHKGAQKSGDKNLQKFYEHLMSFHLSDGGHSEMNAAIKLLRDGLVEYDHYQHVNPSEFWAVNGTRIMQGRFFASGSVLGKLRQWLREFAQKAKALFGLKSDAPIIRALDSLIKGDGKFQTESMLMEGASYDMFAGQQALESDLYPHYEKQIAKLATARLMESNGASAAASVQLNNIERVAKPATRAQVEQTLAKLPVGSRAPVRTIWSTLREYASRGLDKVVFTADLLDRAVKAGLKSASDYQRLMVERGVKAREHELRVEAIADMYQAIPSMEEGKRANDLARESTRLGKWAYQPSWLKPVKVDPVLNAEWNKLDPKAQAWVDAMFKFEHDMLDRKRKTVLDSTSSTYDAMIKAAQDAIDSGTLDEAELKAAKRDLAEAKRNKANEIREFERLFETRAGMPYLPLKRFGSFAVVAKSAEYRAAEERGDTTTLKKLEQDENHYYVDFAETLFEANTMRDQLEREFGTGNVESFEREQFENIYGSEGMLATMSKLRNIIESRPADDKTDRTAMRRMQSILSEMYLQALAENSARKSEMRRKGIAGDIDMLRSFTTQGKADAQFLSMVEYNDRIQESIQRMRREAAKSGAAQRMRASALFNEINKRYNQSLVYDPSPIAQKIARLTSVWFLATSPGYYLQNLTQPYMVSVPIMAGRHGWSKAAAAQYKAYTELGPVVRSGSATTGYDFTKVPADVRAAVDYLVRRGLVDIGLDTELGEFRVDGTNRVKAGWNKVDKFLRISTQKLEAINRLSTAIAAYRLELAKTGDQKAAMDYAAKVINDTHGDYTAFNAPRAFNTNFGKIALQFRKFQLIQLTLLAKLWRDAGLSTPEKRAAAAALGFVLGHTAVMAGVMGLPGYAAIALALGALFGDDEDPFDLTQWLRSKLGNEEIANLIMRGTPTLVGADMSGKIGMGNALSILPFTDVDLLDRRSSAEALGTLVGGASFGLFQRMADGIALIANGDYYKGIEQLMPKGITDVMKAVRYASDGVTRRNGDVTIPASEISEVEAVMQALGVPVSKITVRNEKQQYVFKTTQGLADAASRIKNDYARAARHRDLEAMREARQRWERLQQNRKELGLKPQPISTLLKAPQEQAKRERNTINGVQFNSSNRGLVESL